MGVPTSIWTGVDDAVEDLALPGLLRIAADRFPVCLYVQNALEAFIAHRCVQDCGRHPGRRFGVSVEYGVSLQGASLPQLARRLPAEVDPERLRFFVVS